MKEEVILRKVLKDNQYKVTDARLYVFKLLQGNGPQTLARLVANSKNNIDRVSVYRVVNLYEKLGIIRRIAVGWKYKVELSEIFLEHHHHMSCLACGKVVAIAEDETIERRIKKISTRNNFTLTSHTLEFQGYCSNCRR